MDPTNLWRGIQTLAAANKVSPTAGKLWSGTPVSNFILGQPNYATAPQQTGTVSGAKTGEWPGSQPGQILWNAPTNNSTVVGGAGKNGGTPPPPAGTNVPTGPSQGEQDQVNQQYQNSMNYLNQLESDYQQSGQAYQGAAGVIGSDYANMQQALQNRGTEQNAVVNQQQGQVDLTAQNALTQARQLYNELSQGQIARYGTGSSAGPAASEILGRATAQQFGNVSNTQQQGTQALGLERTKIQNFLQEKQSQFDTEHQKAIQDLQNQFRDALRQVQMQKSNTENAKAQANLQLLSEYRQQAQQIQQAKEMADIQLQTWAKAKDMGLGQVAGFGVNPNTGNYYSGNIQTSQNQFNPAGTPGGPASNAGTGTNAASAYGAIISDPNLTAEQKKQYLAQYGFVVQ